MVYFFVFVLVTYGNNAVSFVISYIPKHDLKSERECWVCVTSTNASKVVFGFGCWGVFGG